MSYEFELSRGTPSLQKNNKSPFKQVWITFQYFPCLLEATAADSLRLCPVGKGISSCLHGGVLTSETYFRKSLHFWRWKQFYIILVERSPCCSGLWVFQMSIFDFFCHRSASFCAFVLGFLPTRPSILVLYFDNFSTFTIKFASFLCL